MRDVRSRTLRRIVKTQVSLPIYQSLTRDTHFIFDHDLNKGRPCHYIIDADLAIVVLANS